MEMNKKAFVDLAKRYGATSFMRETTQYKDVNLPDHLYAMKGKKLVGHWSEPAGAQIFTKNINQWNQKGRTFIQEKA